MRKRLEALFPDQDPASAGWTVHTTLNLDRQRAAQRALRRGLHAFDAKHKGYRPIRRLKPRQIDAERGRARKRHRDGLKAGEATSAVVLKVGKASLKVAVGDIEGDLFLPETGRANPDDAPLSKLFDRGDLLQVTADKDAAPGARAVLFHMAPSAQGAVVSIDVATRHVEALVGGYDFEESNFNRATQARRQTGSAFKPFVYGAALADRISTPATIWLDAPKPFAIPGGKTWNPKNADGKYKGPLTLRRALALSRNVVAVRILERVGIPRVQQFARDLGIDADLVSNYPMALGSSELTLLDMTAAFANLAQLGRRAEPVFIQRVEDSFGRTLHAHEARATQALPPEVAWLLVDVMRSVLTEGTASRIGKKLGRPAAGKTGTTNRARDAWFVGFTPQKVTGVWGGHDNNEPRGRGASGGGTAAPIWLDVMQGAHEKLPKADFKRPPTGIVEARIDPRSGKLAPDGFPNARLEFFLAGTAPTEYAPTEEESTAGDFILNQGSEEDEAPEDVEAEE